MVLRHDGGSSNADLQRARLVRLARVRHRWLRDGNCTNEAVRPACKSGREKKGVGGTGTSAVSEDSLHRLPSLNGKPVLSVICPRMHAGEGIGVDRTVAGVISDEQVAAELSPTRGCKGNAPWRLKNRAGRIGDDRSSNVPLVLNSSTIPPKASFGLAYVANSVPPTFWTLNAVKPLGRLGSVSVPTCCQALLKTSILPLF